MTGQNVCCEKGLQVSCASGVVLVSFGSARGKVAGTVLRFQLLSTDNYRSWLFFLPRSEQQANNTFSRAKVSVSTITQAVTSEMCNVRCSTFHMQYLWCMALVSCCLPDFWMSADQHSWPLRLTLVFFTLLPSLLHFFLLVYRKICKINLTFPPLRDRKMKASDKTTASQTRCMMDHLLCKLFKCS